ncbi:ABC transporter substrate-binding protein [Nocardioides sp. SYSU D00038]|uniref:ABC transporter substrate-binding protein n=1 Tax=Nocardioides sp. SYSU D00038 TaxID=2812554 RepID=UPI0019682D61|nr:extracellular solute-binding protein [Nocardioides sp. SYSU D00038]
MRRTAALPLAIAAVLALGACGGSADDAPSSTTPEPTADVGDASAVTPVDDEVLEAAKEEGEVLMYTNAEDQQTAPIKKAFEAAYPEITLRSLPLEDQQMFQRYDTEVATGSPTADVVMSNDALGWLDFIEAGNVEPYADPNAANLPDYATLGPGVYAISEDPVIALFNKALLPEAEQPTTMEGLAAMAEELDGRIGTTALDNSVAYGATSAYLGKYGEDGWANLEAIGPHASVEASSGPLATKLAQGQYAAAFFVGGAVRAFIVDDVAKVVNYRYFEDGTPLLPRGLGVTAEAPHPNAGKVFLNWMLSVEGQEAACEGGFTPYRDGVECDFGLPQVIAAVGGEDNLNIGTYDRSLAEDEDAITSRWNEAFGR